MVYISAIITHILHITNHAGPSVRAAIHVLHSGHISTIYESYYSVVIQTLHFSFLFCWCVFEGWTLNLAKSRLLNLRFNRLFWSFHIHNVNFEKRPAETLATHKLWALRKDQQKL